MGCGRIAECRDCWRRLRHKARGLCSGCYVRRYRAGVWYGPLRPPEAVAHVCRRITGEVTTSYTFTVYPRDMT